MNFPIGGFVFEGILLNGAQNNVPTTASGLAFARTTTQVLNIVHGSTTAAPGLFFPKGANGVISKRPY